MAEIIRKAIRQDGRTIYRLALDSGVNAPIIRRFVSGERGLNLDTADRLCRTLGLELRPARKRKDK